MRNLIKKERSYEIAYIVYSKVDRMIIEKKTFEYLHMFQEYYHRGSLQEPEVCTVMDFVYMHEEAYLVHDMLTGESSQLST